MLAHLIFNYLTAHEGKANACLIQHADGKMSVMNFHKKDQEVELMRQNKWACFKYRSSANAYRNKR
jgi:hypothetical protein